MNFLTTLKKGVLGLLTFGVAYLATNPDLVLKLVPDQIEKMTVGGLVAAALVMIANWLKNKAK